MRVDHGKIYADPPAGRNCTANDQSLARARRTRLRPQRRWSGTSCASGARRNGSPPLAAAGVPDAGPVPFLPNSSFHLGDDRRHLQPELDRTVTTNSSNLRRIGTQIQATDLDAGRSPLPSAVGDRVCLRPQPGMGHGRRVPDDAKEHARNQRNTLGKRATPVQELCSFVGNVLRSVDDASRIDLLSSCVLFPGCTSRPQHHRLLAAIRSLGLKPVACTGFLLGLSQETSHDH